MAVGGMYLHLGKGVNPIDPDVIVRRMTMDMIVPRNKLLD